MLKTLLNKIIFHLKDNFAYYGVSAAALLSGAVIAAVCAFSLPELSAKELALYFDDFFVSLAESGTDSGVIMLSAVKSNAISFIVLALLSTMVIGAPFIVLVGLYRGFAFGFAVSFMFKVYGIRALLFVIGAVLPHILITLPCITMLLAFCLRFCTSLKRDKGNLKKRLLQFVICLAGIFLLSLAGALMQAYIEPILLECFAGYFA